MNEYWIRKGNFLNYSGHHHCITNVGTKDYWEGNTIHVIEYAALEQANEEIHDLKKNIESRDFIIEDLEAKIDMLKEDMKFYTKIESKLSIAVEALQRYANGQALKVKPEKIHLYIDDICHGNPLWHQRSMSDYDDRLLAKEALEKLRG